MSRHAISAACRSAPLWWSAAVPLTVGAGLLVAADGSPSWRFIRVMLVVVAVGSVLALRATDGRWAGGAAMVVGVVGLAMGLGIGLRFALAGEVWWRGAVGIAVLLAALVLTVIGLRSVVAGLPRWQRVAVRFVAVPGVLVVLSIVLPGVLATNVPPTTLGAKRLAEFGVVARDVEYLAEDGTHLSAWYVASHNGAAVVLRHGAGSTRTSVIAQAVVLARHGYGVLLTDARGHGRSGGRAMDFGWNGDADITASVSFLADQPDVELNRIGVVGLSMGGEEAIGAAAADDRISAVVAEGATGRVAADKAWLNEAYGWRGRVQQGVEWLQSAVTDVLTEARRPGSLAASVRAAAPCRFLLIAAGEVADEPRAADHISEAAPDRVSVWVVPGAGHTEGLATDPSGWESRVIAFLASTLGAAAG